MEQSKIMRILEDNAYVRPSGTEEELRCAEYIRKCCEELGMEAHLEPFAVSMGTVTAASLEVDGKAIPCTGYRLAGSGTVEAPFYYLANNDPWSLAQCKGKIVMIDSYLGYWVYQDLVDNGALAFITFNGNCNYADSDIDPRELRPATSKGRKIIGVNINAKDAVEIVKSSPKMAKITLEGEESSGFSHNVVADLPGEVPETIVLSAHYDSVPLSQGVYDNMSGAVGILGVAEYFLNHPHRYSLRFVWCGSEERGLLGSKAYCAAHEAELPNTVFNVNVDMIGSIMGKFIACCSCEEALCHHLSYIGMEEGFGIKAYQEVYSSDSTPFADHGVPSLSFARLAPGNTANIHSRYDTMAIMKAEQMAEDIRLITLLTEKLACAKHLPVSREIPEAVKEKLDYYMCRKRKK